MSNNCISKCYKSNVQGINPSFLNSKTSKNAFCFDDILNRDSIKDCDLINDNTNSLLLPTMNFNESIVLKLVYNIDNWTTCLDYCSKYKNILLKNTLKRIIEYSWISFFSSYKVNIDNIINIYYIYLEISKNVMSKDEISKKLYTIKNLDLDEKKILIKLSETFEK